MYMHWVSDVPPKLPWPWMEMEVLGARSIHMQVAFKYLVLLLLLLPLLLLPLWQSSRCSGAGAL
jgi:hypothetical protein